MEGEINFYFLEELGEKRVCLYFFLRDGSVGLVIANKLES